MKQIQIARQKGYYGMMRTLNIIVDGEKIGTVKQGDSITLDLPSDARDIWGKMDWAVTERIDLDSLNLNKPLVFKAYFTLNPFRNIGIMKMPFRIFQGY